MLTSKATTVTEFLGSLPADRRREVVAVRKMVKAHTPRGYKERYYQGMILWEIPLTTYADTHNGQPLSYVAISVHKTHLALYLMGAYWLNDLGPVREAFRREGKELDMGKACIRFAKADDLPLAALGKVIKSLPPGLFIMRYEQLRKR
jgi:hypothetical protein